MKRQKRVAPKAKTAELDHNTSELSEVILVLYPKVLIDFLHVPPQERYSKMYMYLKSRFEELKVKYNITRNTKVRIRRNHGMLIVTCNISEAIRSELALEADVSHIYSAKSTENVVTSSEEQIRWFAVVTDFVFQVEGAKEGQPMLIDRQVLLVRATSFSNAENIILNDVNKRYGTGPYLNPSGKFCRIRFSRIHNIYDIGDEEPKPLGWEVYSELKNRKFQESDTWVPKTEDFDEDYSPYSY